MQNNNELCLSSNPLSVPLVTTLLKIYTCNKKTMAAVYELQPVLNKYFAKNWDKINLRVYDF